MTEVVDRLTDTSPRLAENPTPVLLLPRPRARDFDLPEAVCRAVQASAEPLTLSKIRAQLPGALRRLNLEALAETLHRQVEAGVLYAYCPYRSQQPRYWHRPMPDHIAALIACVLDENPLTWSQLLRKLPEYAHSRAEEILQIQLTQGRLHRHPGGPRGGEPSACGRPIPAGRCGRDWPGCLALA